MQVHPGDDVCLIGSFEAGREGRQQEREVETLYYALAFLVVGVIAGALVS